MKTILVPTQSSPAMRSTLETALVLGQRTGAYIEGIPLWFGVPEFVVSELASSFSMETYRGRREEETAEARQLFESFMKQHGVAPTRAAVPGATCRTRPPAACPGTGRAGRTSCARARPPRPPT